MKLVEILARELEEWPEPNKAISQDQTKCLNKLDRGLMPSHACRELVDGVWRSSTWTRFSDLRLNILASDYETAIITRADWEAERARIKGEQAMPKANKDGWLRHRGGKQPAHDDVRVEYRMRSGRYARDLAGSLDWGHYDHPTDIMAWKVSKDDKCAPVVSPEFTTERSEGGAEMPAAKQDGPLQWRDRIHTIDFDKAAAQKAHEAAMAALDSERAELVAKLKAEGLALVQAEVDNHQEDMSDPANWKAGDMVESLEEEEDISKGGIYKIIEIAGGDIAFRDNAGDRRCRDAEDYKWHSRPSH